jgi:hypothetical protein
VTDLTRPGPAGIYVFRGDLSSGRLELRDEGDFYFLSVARGGQERREATGRWRLEGRSLLLVYEVVGGQAIEPEREVSRWEGDRIVMPGPAGDLVLEKRNVLRIR